LQREEARVSNQAFNRDHQEACTHQMNMEEAQNRASQTLAKPMKKNMQTKTSEKWHHAKYK